MTVPATTASLRLLFRVNSMPFYAVSRIAGHFSAQRGRRTIRPGADPVGLVPVTWGKGWNIWLGKAALTSYEQLLGTV